MQVIVAVVGRARHAILGPAAHEYESRAARYWPLKVEEVRDAGGRLPPVEAREREGRALLQISGDAYLVACDVGGRSYDSPGFSRWLQQRREQARDLCIVIGGAHGLSAEVLRAADLRLSLAPWTLPHELARVVLAEQLYRAGTIVRGEPYHK